MEQQTFGCRLGLAVLLHEGVAAWIEAWGRCTTSPVSAQLSPPTENAFSNKQHAEVVRVLANMTLDNLRKEIRA